MWKAENIDTPLSGLSYKCDKDPDPDSDPAFDIDAGIQIQPGIGYGSGSFSDRFVHEKINFPFNQRFPINSMRNRIHFLTSGIQIR